MDVVPRPVVPRVVTLARTFALVVARVVADKPGTAHQEVKQEAEHLHADGNEEEDEGVPPLVRDQQLGEDAREGDDHPRCAWKHAGQGETRGEVRGGGCAHERNGAGGGFGLTLSGHHPLRVPLGQHPHVTIETGLLNWGGMKKRFTINCLSIGSEPCPPLRETGQVLSLQTGSGSDCHKPLISIA